MQLLNGVVVCAIGIGVLVVSLTTRRDMGGPGLALFRVLLPSWRFFEAVQPAPRLLCRFASEGAELGDWHELLMEVPRPWHALVLNARGNLRLACHGLLEQLQSELQTLTPACDPTELVSYQLLRCTVLKQLASLPHAATARRFQFCIAEPAADVAGSTGQQLLLSEIHERDALRTMNGAACDCRR